MDKATVSIRELRLNFRSVKRKVEEYGKVLVTDNGVPSYVITAAPPEEKKERRPLPDYYARLLKRQPVPLTAEQAKALHEENRGDR
jgi:antitoxin (DNA-binding transcriptional repressor) of toxin-antitoxin stability system